jgi:propionyl-CoA carboxylase beta chain
VRTTSATDEDRCHRVRQGAAVVSAQQQPRGAPDVRDRERPDAFTDEDLELDTIIPDSANQPYDMKTVIEHLVDDGEFLEVQALFAPNILCGFAASTGRSVGIVANQPMQFAGTLDIDASEKAARFVRTCDAFNIPILTLVDVPGFLPGTTRSGMASSGAAPS